MAHTAAFVRQHLPRRRCRVLEVGCGDGELAASLQNSRCVVVAIDEDVNAVRRSRRRGVDARRAQWPKFRDGLFDAILFVRSVHECDDMKSSIAHAVQQLRPGGRLLIEDFDFAAANGAAAMWLHGVASGLAAAGALQVRHWLVAGLLGNGSSVALGPEERRRTDMSDGHDNLRRLVVATGLLLKEESTEYLFRYVDAASPAVQEQIQRAEAALISAGSIEPLGRRFVVGQM